MNRQGYKKRVREDAQTWRDRLIGKRIVTADPDIAAYDAWKSTDYSTTWEPRAYFCQPVGQGLERNLEHEPQTASALLQLPAELRSQILERVLPPEMLSQKTDVDGIEQGDAIWMNTSAVIFTCKQLYAEGRALAVSKHTFPYENFPKKTRLCAAGSADGGFTWNLLNVVCDANTNVVKQVFYR